MTAQTLTDVSPFVLAAAVLLMLFAESLAPLVPLLSAPERVKHALGNVSLALVTALFAVGGSFLLVAAAAWATARGFGLLNLFETPWPLRFFVALAGIDLFEWVRHRLHHRVPLLWRIHRVHHSDPHVDATTALRGHPLESLLAYSYFTVLVALLGIDPLALALRSLVAVMALAWHHSALALPARLDAWVSLVTPTPRTHRLHHARDVLFTDSNYGTLFTWWDRLMGTFTPGDARPAGQTGLDGFDGAEAQSLKGVLLSPLRTPAPSRAPGLP